MLFANRFFNLTIYSSCMRCLKILSARVKYSLLSPEIWPHRCSWFISSTLLELFQRYLSKFRLPHVSDHSIFGNKDLPSALFIFLICEPNQSQPQDLFNTANMISGGKIESAHFSSNWFPFINSFTACLYPIGNK